MKAQTKQKLSTQNIFHELTHFYLVLEEDPICHIDKTRRTQSTKRYTLPKDEPIRELTRKPCVPKFRRRKNSDEENYYKNEFEVVEEQFTKTYRKNSERASTRVQTSEKKERKIDDASQSPYSNKWQKKLLREHFNVKQNSSSQYKIKTQPLELYGLSSPTRNSESRIVKKSPFRNLGLRGIFVKLQDALERKVLSQGGERTTKLSKSQRNTEII